MKQTICYITCENASHMQPESMSTVADLVKTLAPQVPQGLLQAKGQRLSRTLHMHYERHSEHILILIVWYLHSLHKLWHRPRRDIKTTSLIPCSTGLVKDCADTKLNNL